MKKVLSLATVILALPLGVFLFLALSRGGEKIKAPEAVAQKEPAVVQLRQLESASFPVFWLGEEYNGLPLADFQYIWDPGEGIRRPVERVQLVYASCRPGREIPPEEGGCGESFPTFVSVQTYRFCLNRPSILVESAKRGPKFRLKDADAQQTDSHNLHLYAGQATIVVFSSEGDESALEAARNLRGANAVGRAQTPTAASPLGPPIAEQACSGFRLPPRAIPRVTPATTATEKATAAATAEPKPRTPEATP